MIQDATAVECQLWLPEGKICARSLIRSSSRASNYYAHLKQMHVEAYSVLLLITRSRDKNKCRYAKSSSIKESINNSRENKFKGSVIALYSSADMLSRVFRSQGFTQVIHVLSLNVV